jgi:ABC-type glycerol-3-phosphate transport system substrate-binding protein
MENIWPVIIGLFLLVLAFVVWEWLKGQEAKILISAYGDLQENRILIDLINEFRKKYPDVQVELERFPFNEYAQKVLNAINRGSGPDVAFLELAHFSDFYFNQVLEPLNPFVEADRLDMKAYYPQIVDQFTVDRHLYALPRDTAPICMVYYNKKAFDEAGVPYPKDDWNWDQFVETAKKVMKTDAGGQVTRWGFVEGWAMLDAWVYDAGGSFVDNAKHPTRWTFTSDPDSLRGARFRWDLIHKHKVMPPPSIWSGADDVEGVEMFIDERAAMILFGLWKTPRFREIRNFQWDAAMIPRDPNGHLDFNLSGSAYGIPKASRNKKAAWKFMRFISSEEGARKLAEAGLAQPALMKIAESPLFLDGKDPQNKKMLLEAMKYGKCVCLSKNWLQVRGIIETGLQEAWEGKVSIEEAIERLKPLLEKNPPRTL